jgi:hypothetical protein
LLYLEGKTADRHHAFDQECAQQGGEHRLIPPAHPQTNDGMIEHFASVQELEKTLYAYLKVYNHHVPQKALKHQTPIQARYFC